MYEIIGYDWECIDFNYKVDSFMKAIELVINLNRGLCIVFLSCDGRNINTFGFPMTFNAPKLPNQKTVVTVG